MALLLQGDSPDLNVTPEDVASQRLGGTLFVGGAGLTGGAALAGVGAGSTTAGTTAASAACADGNCSNEATTALQRAGKLLSGEPGYNVASESTFSKYAQIGRVASYVTDQKAISDVLGEFEGKGGTISVTAQQAAKLEQSLGLNEGTLANGFRISRVADVVSRSPARPMVGNATFLGPGKGLPGGGPELIVSALPTQVQSGIEQIIVIIKGN